MREIKINKTLILISTVATFFMLNACSNTTFKDAHRDDINKVPLLFETPDAEVPEDFDKIEIDTAGTTTTDTTESDDSNTAADENEITNPDAATPEEREIPRTTPPRQQPSRPTPTRPAQPAPRQTEPSSSDAHSASKFIKVAHWVMLNEGRKIGTACNFYLMRVLELAGFRKDSFLANDFDVYARRNFSDYKTANFNGASGQNSERARLKRFLWSHPSRTPFILQWQRARGAGHVAIIERIGEQIIIYQASLNKHTARREQTTVELLLNAAGRARLTVYSDFKP